MSQNGIPYARLGLNTTQFKALLRRHRNDASKAGNGSEYLKSERGVKALARLVGATRDDPELCGLILTVTERVYRELAEKEAKEKALRKKYKASTIGMFY